MADEETIFNFNGTLQEKGKKVLIEDNLNSLATKIELNDLATKTELDDLATKTELDDYITKTAKALMAIEYEYCLTESKNNSPASDDPSWESNYTLPTNTKPYLWCKITKTYSDTTSSTSNPILIMEYKQGEDGFSPTISSQPVTNEDTEETIGTEITITNKDGNDIVFTILNGVKGDTPKFNFIPEVIKNYPDWTTAFNITAADENTNGYVEGKENYVVTFPNYPGTNVYIDPIVNTAIEEKPSIQRMLLKDYYNTYVNPESPVADNESLSENQIIATQKKLGLSEDNIVLINDQLHTEIIRFCIPRGPKGEPAVFAENISAENITASIIENDEYNDNPTVEVGINSSIDEDGNTSSNLSFTFEGIRGQTGSAPIIRNTESDYETDNNGPRIIVNSSPASDEEGNPIKDTIDLDFTFYNLKGEPGLTKIEHVVNKTSDDLLKDTPIINIGTGQVKSGEEITDEENETLSVGTNYLKITRGKITPDAIVGTVKKINGGTGYGTANQDPDAVALPWSIAPATEDTDVIGARVIDELYQYLTQKDSVYINIDSIDDLLENNQNLYIYDSNNNEYEALNWNDFKFEMQITKISNEQYRVYDISNASTFNLPLEYIDEDNRVSWQNLVENYQSFGYDIPFIYSYEDSLYPVSLDNQNLIIGNDNDGSILTSLIDNHLIDLSPLIQEESTTINISFDDVYSIAHKFYDDDNIYKESGANKTEDSQSRYSIDSVKELATNLVNELLDLQDKVTEATKIAADDIILIGPATKVSDIEVIPKETDPDKLSRAKIWIRTVEEGE